MPTNYIEGVITHLLGHSIGMRHSDWFSKKSCVIYSPENPNCAIHIPGTPTGFDAQSIFNTCIDPNTDGELSTFDKVAMYYLY